MFLKLLCLFIVIPLVELYLLLSIGKATDSLLLPIGMVLLTAVVGATLVKAQGKKAFDDIKAELSIGSLPGDALLDGLLILMAGALFLTPGLLTDLLAITLALPITRSFYRARLKGWCKKKITMNV
ncbi:MAG: FxsA family protein [Planctomycetota bacterium]|nr:FxsA family protein [Planctomycetota bacterium]